MKRLLVLAVVLVLLAVMVSSVSADVIIDPPPVPKAAGQGTVTAEHVVQAPPIYPEAADDGIATPILF